MALARRPLEEDGILVFDSHLDHRSTYDARHLEQLHEAEKSHFWFLARREKICRIFESYVDKKASILEIGGGTGFVAEKLIKNGFSIDMADIHLNGLRFAKQKGISRLYQFDLFSPPFQEEFDCICLFDVLEHLKEENSAFECLKKMLKPGGQIIFTVPSHQWLWSRDDVIAGHERRYTKKYLEKVLFQNRLEPVHIQYFFSSIVPLLLLRRFLRRDDKTPLKQGEKVEMTISPLLNKALYSMTKAEFWLEKFFPLKAGGSLIAVAKKPV